jgi:small-conductance mechanosensitive channel
MTVELIVVPDTDLAVVERVGVEVARTVMKDVPGGIPGAEPSVRFTAFGDYGIRVGVNVRTAEFSEQALVRHELIKRLQTALKDAGVDVATMATGARPPS